MAFWSAGTLRTKLPTGIVSDFDPKRVGLANYTLRMGQQAYVTPEQRVANSAGRCLTSLDKCNTCTIPPGQFGFLLTEETVKVPHNAIAFISVRATYKFMGLVNVSGFHVDPSWEGPLIFAVFNGGPSPVTVKRFDELFHIWFADLDEAAVKGAPKLPKSDGIGSEVINGLGDQLISLAGLSNKFDALESEHQKLSQATATKTALLIAAVVSLAAIAANLWLSEKPRPAVQLDQRGSFQPSSVQPGLPRQKKLPSPSHDAQAVNGN